MYRRATQMPQICRAPCTGCWRSECQPDLSSARGSFQLRQAWARPPLQEDAYACWKPSVEDQQSSGLAAPRWAVLDLGLVAVMCPLVEHCVPPQPTASVPKLWRQADSGFPSQLCLPSHETYKSHSFRASISHLYMVNRNSYFASLLL